MRGTRLDTRKEIVIVGGGWAGYSAAMALFQCEDAHVTVLEAAPRAGGLAGVWRTEDGRPIEADIHGF